MSKHGKIKSIFTQIKLMDLTNYVSLIMMKLNGQHWDLLPNQLVLSRSFSPLLFMCQTLENWLPVVNNVIHLKMYHWLPKSLIKLLEVGRMVQICPRISPKHVSLRSRNGSMDPRTRVTNWNLWCQIYHYRGIDENDSVLEFSMDDAGWKTLNFKMITPRAFHVAYILDDQTPPNCN